MHNNAYILTTTVQHWAIRWSNMALDWDHLRVFLAVARAGQLLAAGRRLRLDHATVGRRIDALERSVGGKLLERVLRQPYWDSQWRQVG